MIADFTRGRLENLARFYTPGIVRGIALHRSIDQYTDFHSCTLASKQRFSKQRRRYAGIIIDILYDHFLSRHWACYTTVERKEFIAESYRLMSENHARMPQRMQHICTLMAEQDWLGGYFHLEQVGFAYDRLAIRLRQPNNLAGSIKEVRQLYPLLERDFKVFFPQITDHATAAVRQ